METYNAIVERTDRWYVARCPELPEAGGGGATYQACIDELRASIEAIMAVDSGAGARRERRISEFRLISERERMIDEIHAAFSGVSRGRGVSWSEAEVLDDYGGPTECAEARALDKDTSWKQLIDDPQWEPVAGVGGWSFLDALGFRYYLPAAMIRCLRSGYNEGIQFHLTFPGPRSGLREYKQKQWSLLDERQRRCVARFIDCMVLITDCDIDRKGWVEARSSHWQQFS